jgi:hypothetical protein
VLCGYVGSEALLLEGKYNMDRVQASIKALDLTNDAALEILRKADNFYWETVDQPTSTFLGSSKCFPALERRYVLEHKGR